MVFSHGPYQYGVRPFYKLHNNGIRSRLLTDTFKQAAGREFVEIRLFGEGGSAVGRVLRLLCLS